MNHVSLTISDIFKFICDFHQCCQPLFIYFPLIIFILLWLIQFIVIENTMPYFIEEMIHVYPSQTDVTVLIIWGFNILTIF